MDIQLKENQKPEPINNEDDAYRYPSTDIPKLEISRSISSLSTRFSSDSRKKSKKRVTFNRNVTVVNIQSYKKSLRKNNYQKPPSVFEDDFNEDRNEKCRDCEIF